MEDPAAYLRAMAAPLAWAEEGSPLPVTRFSVEAVANAFVILGLLPRDVPGRSSPRSRRRCKRSACR
jgi:hypothetical protein